MGATFVPDQISHINGLTTAVSEKTSAAEIILPPNLRDHQWCPVPMRPATTIGVAGTKVILWMDPVAGVKFWGRDTANSQLLESVDDGQTWSNVGAAFAQAPVGVRSTSDGQLLVSTTQASGVPGKVYRSTNYGSVALGSTNFVLVQSAISDQVFFTSEWGMDCWPWTNVVVLTEYGNKLAPGPYASRTFVSFDKGKPGSFFLAHLHDQVDQAHKHGGCWDPYEERLIAVTGDMPYNSIIESRDKGATWQTILRGPSGTQGRQHTTAYGAIQPVSAIAVPDGIIFGMDSAPNGLGFLPRVGRGRTPYFKAGIVTEPGDGVLGIAGQAYWRGEGYPIHFPFYRVGSVARSYVVSTMDGHDYTVIYRDLVTRALSDGVGMYYGPTASGKNIGVLRIGATYSKTTCNAETWHQRNNRAPQAKLTKYVRFSGPYSGDTSKNTQIEASADTIMQANLGDRTFRWRGSLDALQPGGITQQGLIASHTANQNFYFVIRNSDRKAELLWWQQDGTIRNTISGVLPFADKEIFTIECQVDVDAGGGNRSTSWFYSTDYDPQNREESPGTWTTLGGGGVVAGVSNFRHLTAPVTIGAYSGGSGGRMIGNWEWAEIRAGLGNAGIVILDPDVREPQTRLGDTRYASDPQVINLLIDSSGTAWTFGASPSNARVRGRVVMDRADFIDILMDPLTAANASAVNSGDATTDTVINNIRTRVNELESRLRLNGVVT